MCIQINLIVAFCKKFGIGFQNQIPWNIRPDLIHFQKLTKGHVVVMGRKTYDSLPAQNKPLKDRLNVVITNTPELYLSHDKNELIYLTYKKFYDFLYTIRKKNVFVIGGTSIYNLFNHISFDNIHVTYIEKEITCDRFFEFPNFYKLVHASEAFFSDTEQCTYRFLKYQRDGGYHQEYQYLDLLKDIIILGNQRPDRTQTGTVGLFGQQIRFNISQTIPVLTTKFVPFKMVVKELLWFLKGHTDNKILQEQGVHIWDGNTSRQFLDQRGLSHYKEGDIGPMYGYQWRHYGAIYDGCDKSYKDQGIDQLAIVLDLLKNDPFSRRIAMTTYNVTDLEKGVLHPCHGIFVQFYVSLIDDQKHLSCHMTQRSVDCGCGLPFNIASYAVLTHLIAKKIDMIPNELVISMGDTHIYSNHIEALSLQVSRNPYPFPILKLSDVKDKDWDDITVDDFELIGYFNHPTIKLKMNI
jgi:thymidylate synthase